MLGICSICYELFSSNNVAFLTHTIKLSRFLHTSSRVHRNHYDSLGLTPKASQADIKKAYYKLSLKFHPDKTEGQGDKFREITAAYEVLGNFKLRRLYDRGSIGSDGPVLNPTTSQPKPGTDVKRNPFDSKSALRNKVASTGQSGHYDYDAWSREHYGKILYRNKETKQKIEHKAELRRQSEEIGSLEKIIFGVVVIFLVMGLCMSTTSFSAMNYDQPRKKSS